MVKFRYTDRQIVEEAFNMGAGYVLDFSDRTIAEFFQDEVGVDLYDARYDFNGSSKAKRLRAFFEVEEERLVAKALRALWAHRELLRPYASSPDHERLRALVFGLVERLEGTLELPLMDAIERFKVDETLEELIDGINRDIGANKPHVALDRLHTYCMKKFSHLLDQHGVPWTVEEPLNSRVGKYVKELERQHPLQDMTKRILKSSIGVFDRFNSVRNNKSLAHDNDLLDLREARFIFDSLSAILRFFKAMETTRFGS